MVLKTIYQTSYYIVCCFDICQVGFVMLRSAEARLYFAWHHLMFKKGPVLSFLSNTLHLNEKQPWANVMPSIQYGAKANLVI